MSILTPSSSRLLTAPVPVERKPTRRRRSRLPLLLTYTGSVLWHQRQRYLAAVLAVAFSAVLINLQWGLVLGIYSGTSLPVDQAAADVWVGAPNVPSVDAGRLISENHLSRLAGQPGVERPESLIVESAYWVNSQGVKEGVLLIGSHVSDGALGASHLLTPELRSRLTEPGAVVIDESERDRLGVGGVGEVAEVNGRRVRTVGFIRGVKGLRAPYVFCSIDTARLLLGLAPDQTTYLLARCPDPATAAGVVRQLKQYSDLSAFTKAGFSFQTQFHWLFKTPGGTTTTFMALLALVVGAVVASQTLYAATVSSLREYAVLRALGIPRWRIGAFILTQAFGVGLVGVTLAVPIIYSVGWCASVAIGTQMVLPVWLLATFLALTVGMALCSGLSTLRALRLMEPNLLLR